MNTIEFLTVSSAICPDRAAIHFEGRPTSFAELEESANRVANGLAAAGVESGDRVAFLHVNCPEAAAVYFGTAKLGAIYVPLNFRAKADELDYMINTAGAKAVFVGARYAELTESIRTRLTSVTSFVVLEGERDGYQPWGSFVDQASPDPVFSDVADDATTILMYTAGTTGFPKGVMLSHNSFSIYMLNNVAPADPEVEERNILTVPLYHIAGIQALLAAVYGGRTVVMQRQFDPADWLEQVESQRVDRAMMVPTMLKQLMEYEDFPKRDVSSLKVITYGAAPMPLEVIKQAIRVFPNARFINAFGQTESASTITMLGPADHDLSGSEADIERKLKRLTSIGKAMDDVIIMIKSEEGEFLGPNEVGEIVAQGPRVMQGYWKDDEKTEATIKDGWLHTGDMGYVDDDGYIFLAGRAKDMIIRGGENISPEEVENVIRSHPAVDDAAVIGVPDEHWGEIVRACVVLKRDSAASAGELAEHCRASLSSFKRPESVVFVDELPRNPMGKVLKRVLREQYGQPERA